MFKICSTSTHVVRNKLGIRQFFVRKLRMRGFLTLLRVAILNLQCATIPSENQYSALGNRFRAIFVK